MMDRFVFAILLVASLSCAQVSSGQSFSQASPQQTAEQPSGAIIVPAGTAVELEVTSPIWTKTAQPGEAVYARTTFPVVADNRMAVPAGTYVSGRIDALTRPGIFSPHATVEITFTQMVLANGYTVTLPNLPLNATAHSDIIAAVAEAYVEVSRASEILLDNGSELEMVLQVPLALDAYRVADAVALNKSAQVGPLASAVVCHPTPGTPGTPDTVIPGTPATPGTPDTVIPGGPGQPDIVIPGTPGTPGTPDTVIPGTPGTPGTICPALPVIIAHANSQTYKGAFQLDTPALVGGTQLPAGTYQVDWRGLDPSVQTEIVIQGGATAQVHARVVLLSRTSPANATSLRTNPDGSHSVDSIRFAGQSFALYFD
jgi:hypothetical protein